MHKKSTRRFRSPDPGCVWPDSGSIWPDPRSVCPDPRFICPDSRSICPDPIPQLPLLTDACPPQACAGVTLRAALRQAGPVGSFAVART